MPSPPAGPKSSFGDMGGWAGKGVTHLSLPAQSQGQPDMGKKGVSMGSDWVRGKPKEGPQEAEANTRSPSTLAS